MILLWLIVILLVGGLLAWAAGRWSASASRWISLIARERGLRDRTC